jgi:hypothetical protein
LDYNPFKLYPKRSRFGENEKKSLRSLYQTIAMTLEEHRDVVGKPLRRLFYIIAKTFFTMMKTEKNIIVSSEKHYSVFEKAL